MMARYSRVFYLFCEVRAVQHSQHGKNLRAPKARALLVALVLSRGRYWNV